MSPKEAARAEPRIVSLMARVVASVIVPTYGGLRRLPALLDALTEQDMSEPWEVVISIDGIVDETKALVEQYRGRLDLVVVESATSTGVSAALNRGFAAASGEVLIRCDDDLTPRRSMVRRHVELHREHPRTIVSAVCRDVAVPTPFGRVYGSRAAAARRQQWYGRPVPDRWIDCAGHLSVDRATWELAAPGFDESIPYGEDSEMAYRLVKRGVEVHLAPELEIEHRGAPRLAANRVPRAFNAGAGSRVFALGHPEAVPAEPPPCPSSFRAAVWSWSIIWRAVPSGPRARSSGSGGRSMSASPSCRMRSVTASWLGRWSARVRPVGSTGRMIFSA